MPAIRTAVTSCLFASVSLLVSCSLPKDPEHTLRQIRGGVLRVGVSENPPWTRFSGPGAGGLEPEFVNGLAQRLHAKVQWVHGGESALMIRLKKHDLDLVVGGLTTRSPWRRELGATQPYAAVRTRDGVERHVMLAPPGENAWLLELDRQLYAQKDRFRSALAGEVVQ